MNDETKKRIKRFLETLKDYEVHGGEPTNYKETLVNLRESIKKGIFEETDSKFREILLYALKEINDNVTTIDTLIMAGSMNKDFDKLIKGANLIQSLASMLIKEDKILLLELIIN